MIFTFFPPRTPRPNQALDDREYKAAHATQTRPGATFDLDELGLLDYIRASATIGRAGDGGYIISGDCSTTRREGGEASFVLIDYDDNPAGPDWALLDAYAGFAWTTASGHPHWRVLIPLVRPFAHGKLECPFPGGHIRNRTQPAFLPTHREDVGKIQWRLLEGAQLLDGEALGKVVAAFEPAAASMLGAAFTVAGMVEGEQHGALIVRCPWQHEHTDGKGGGTVVFHDDEEHTGQGKFHCGHGHCAKRGTVDALEALRFLPAVAAELEHWSAPSLLEPFRRVEAPPPPAAKDSGPWLSWSEIMAPMPQTPWLCEALQLCPGRPAAIVAEPNAGKTWSLQAMALAVAAGLPIFGPGGFPARSGPVLHVSTDAGEFATRKKYQLLARGMGLEARDLPIKVWPGRLRCVNKYGSFDAKGLAPIFEEAAKGYALVILDSLFAIAAGIDMMAPEAAEPLWATKNMGNVWIWAMHTPKGKPGFFGSQAIKAACGVMLTMTLDEGDTKKPRVWGFEKRAEDFDGDEIEAFTTTWDRDLDADGKLLAARILRADAPEPPVPGATAFQQAAWEMLKLVELRGSASASDLLAAAGATAGVKGRIRSRANDVLGRLAHPSSGLLVNPNGEKYILAPGVLVPKAAHQIEVSAP